jgi:hypothetical protein
MNATRAATHWRAADWAAWAGLPADAVTVPPPAIRPAARTRRDAAHIARVVAIFAAIAAVLGLLPYRLPGEVLPSQLHRIERSTCASCPPAQQLIAAGLRHESGRTWLTMRFAAPPQGVHLDVLPAAGSAVTIAQRGDREWTMTVPARDDARLTTFAAGARGDTAVVELPPAAREGVVLRTSQGVAFPSSGTLLPTADTVRTVSALDVVLVVMMLAGAWQGYKRGAAMMAVQLAAVIVIMATVALLGSLLWSRVAALPAVVAALISGATVAALALLVHAALTSSARRFGISDGGPTRERGVAMMLGAARAIIFCAMLAALASDQIVFEPLARLAERSTVAAPLANGWRAIVR